MRVTSITNLDALKRTILAEKKKVLWWVEHKLPAKGLLRHRYDRVVKTMDWTSKEGNKWRVIIDVSWQKRFVFAFFYYQTSSSFMAIHPTEKENESDSALVVFTPHFFQRMAERGGFGESTIEEWGHFVLQWRGNSIFCFNKDSDEVEFLMKNGVGKGRFVYGRNDIIEIKTFLHTTMLNGKQRKNEEFMKEVFELQ